MLAIHGYGGDYPITCGMSCIILSVYLMGVILFIFALIILEEVQHRVCTVRVEATFRPDLVISPPVSYKSFQRSHEGGGKGGTEGGGREGGRVETV